MRTLADRQILAAADRIKKAERKAAVKGRGERVLPVRDGRQREPRVRDNVYLGWIRRLPCVAGVVEGGCAGPVQACHLRMSIPGKPNPGMGAKADDVWTWPGCAHHHIHDQHRGSEAAFFGRLGIDPIALCKALRSAFEIGIPGETVVLDLSSAPQ